MTTPSASIVIPTRAATTGVRVAAHLAELGYTLPAYEILVVAPRADVDIGNPPAADCHIITVPALQPPGAMRNIGFRQAQGTVVCFLDDDCFPEPGWAETLMATLRQDATTGVVACRCSSYPPTFLNRCVDDALFGCAQFRKPRTGPTGAASLAVRREAYEAIGGFDESLYASEDWDFGLRMEGAGWRCRYTPQTHVLHKHTRSSFYALFSYAYRSGCQSGLTVQQKCWRNLSVVGCAALAFRSPWFYPFFAIPYAGLLACWHLVEGVQDGTWPRRLLTFPVVLAAKLIYQAGVYTRLRERKKTTIKNDAGK